MILVLGNVRITVLPVLGFAGMRGCDKELDNFCQPASLPDQEHAWRMMACVQMVSEMCLHGTLVPRYENSARPLGPEQDVRILRAQGMVW
jgi:hypothetical protein